MFEGGKMDDITVIVGNVVVRDGRRRRTSSPTRSRSEGSVQTLAFVTRRSGVVAGSSLCVLSLVVLPSARPSRCANSAAARRSSFIVLSP